MPTQRVSPTFQTPSTPSVFNEVLNHPELLVPDDRASEEVLYLQEHASMNQSMVGRGPFRENFTFSNTPAAQSTPRNTGNQPQSYSDQYRSIMGESPGTHNNSSPMREPLSVTHSDFPELRDRTEYQRSRAQLHATAQLVRNLLVRLGIENQTDRTAVGWLRVLETLATTPLSEMPLNLANNIREPRNASLLIHYVRVIRDQPYRNIVENNDWLSTIPNSSPGSSPNQENPRQRILRLRANLEMLSPEPMSTQTLSNEDIRRRLFDEAMRLGLGELANRARIVLERVGFTPNPHRTAIGWIRAIRNLANVDEESFTPELSQVFEGNNVDIILGLESESKRQEFEVVIDDSLFPSESTPPTSNGSPSQERRPSSSSGSDTPYQTLDGQWWSLPRVRENSAHSSGRKTQQSSPTYVETPQNLAPTTRIRRDTPWAPRQHTTPIGNPLTIISTDSEHDIPPRPSVIPRRARYGDSSNAQEQWEQIPPERQYSDEADPVPPYMEQDWEKYQQQLAIARSFQQQGGSKETGNLNTEQEETHSLGELTNEFLQWIKDTKKDASTEASTIQNQVQTKPLNHRQRRGMEWKLMKERENNVPGLPTPTTTPEQELESQGPTTNPIPVTGNFIRDSPPHQLTSESQFEYTNPYRRDTRPGARAGNRKIMERTKAH
ncbi:hypothetical protein BDP27DRAFT_1365252 [Rhodocollybia butyracea]|uniref:Uncharacterized protein n=1 Tax=Rhodocollybia butyracea TaxID=206335 RepID=A0A9P5U5S5_9AGAR|nr:hypothetical protein BDP27DRAFT_1365252 [Rhodocollybia butyracea]